jgi:hypothetical protein
MLRGLKLFSVSSLVGYLKLTIMSADSGEEL